MHRTDYPLPLMEQRYGAQVRHYQMQMGIGSEIKHLVLQILRDADHALTTHEIAERVEPLLPENVAERLHNEPHHLGVSDIVEGALTILYLDDHRVGKKEVYFPNQQHDA